MKKLLLVLMFSNLANSSKTPAVVIPAPVVQEELTQEDKKLLQKLINMTACVTLQFIANYASTSSETDKEKALELFEKCSANKYFAGFVLSIKADNLIHTESKKEAIRSFVDQATPTDEVQKFLQDFHLNKNNK